MKASKILFATDFSEASLAAFEVAELVARDSGAVLLIVHVHERVIKYKPGEVRAQVDGEHPEVEAQLKALTPSDPKIACEHRLALGLPADELLHVAETEAVDLIVMGTHGRTGLTRLVMGSVTESVLRRAPCPVLVLRPRHP